jgi:hypothetical protein
MSFIPSPSLFLCLFQLRSTSDSGADYVALLCCPSAVYAFHPRNVLVIHHNVDGERMTYVGSNPTKTLTTSPLQAYATLLCLRFVSRAMLFVEDIDYGLKWK